MIFNYISTLHANTQPTLATINLQQTGLFGSLKIVVRQ